MENKINWGVLSTAKIGLKKVIPAMQKGKYSLIHAIASRDIKKAQQAAKVLKISKAYGSYEELLADNEIEAVYIPLPNHLHVEWTIKSLKAHKHVLCEKPIGLDWKEADYLNKEVKKYPGKKVMEAFMYRFHPQWQKVKKLVNENAIGQVKTIHSFFSYFNIDPENIRNQPDAGGGGLMDIGCYCISLSRFLYNSEPERVCGLIEYDPVMNIDRLGSGILYFNNGTSTFTCATQLTYYQHVFIYGTKGRIEIDIPFNPPINKKCRLFIQTKSKTEKIMVPVCNQYTIQGDLFSQSILNDTDVPTPLDDAVANMKVIDRIIESAKNKTWVNI